MQVTRREVRSEEIEFGSCFLRYPYVKMMELSTIVIKLVMNFYHRRTYHDSVLLRLRKLKERLMPEVV